MGDSNGNDCDRRLLAHKVSWEGRILAALEYGIRSEQISDPALRSPQEGDRTT
jgi:hypothetical protein